MCHSSGCLRRMSSLRLLLVLLTLCRRFNAHCWETKHTPPDLMPCLVFALFSIELLKSVLTGNLLSPPEMIFDMKVSWSWVYFRVFGLSSLVYISITRFQVCLVFVLLLVFVPVIEFSLVLCALLLVLLPASCFPWFSSPVSRSPQLFHSHNPSSV